MSVVLTNSSARMLTRDESATLDTRASLLRLLDAFAANPGAQLGLFASHYPPGLAEQTFRTWAASRDELLIAHVSFEGEWSYSSLRCGAAVLHFPEVRVSGGWRPSDGA